MDSGIYHDEIEIEDFDYDSEMEVFSYPCPCGDLFTISKVFKIDLFDIYLTFEYFRMIC